MKNWYSLKNDIPCKKNNWRICFNATTDACIWPIVLWFWFSVPFLWSMQIPHSLCSSFILKKHTVVIYNHIVVKNEKFLWFLNKATMPHFLKFLLRTLWWMDGWMDNINSQLMELDMVVFSHLVNIEFANVVCRHSRLCLFFSLMWHLA
jgi:hypothetical protein